MPTFRRDPATLVVLSVALALAGCGGGRRNAQPAGPAGLTSYAAHGVGLELPRGWLGPRDAFITLQERGRAAGAPPTGFPPRPAHFGPLDGGPFEAGACVPTAHFVEHWLAFSDRGRRFYALVAFGPRASASTRAQAWSILDSLRVDPRVLPNWRSSG